MGTQYRSAVFYHDQSQQQLASEYINALNEKNLFGGKKIVTQVTPATTFYHAEEYHQNYLTKNGLGSCHI